MLGAKKKRIIGISIALIQLLMVSNYCSASESTHVESYPVPENGSIELNVPKHWRTGYGKAPGNYPPTIAMGPADRDIYLKITVFWNIKNDPKFNDPESIRSFVQQMGVQFLPKAEETKI